jgi:hypothetical protein
MSKEEKHAALWKYREECLKVRESKRHKELLRDFFRDYPSKYNYCVFGNSDALQAAPMELLMKPTCVQIEWYHNVLE